MNSNIGQNEGIQLQPQFYFPFHRSQWHDFSQSDHLSDPSTDSRNSTASSEHMMMDLGLPTPAGGGNTHMNPFLNTGHPSSDSLNNHNNASNNALLTPALSQAGLVPQMEFDWNDAATSSSQLDFDYALKLCTDLDRRCRLVKDPNTNCLLDAESHLQALDAVCVASIKTEPQSDSASRALVLAALHKALEVCEALVSALRSGARNSESIMLQQLLLLRRLDIVVTFGRVCFARLGQAMGQKLAEDIHKSIELLLRVDYGQWAW